MTVENREAVAALSRAAMEIGESLIRLSVALGEAPTAGGAQYGPAHTRLPWNERVLRQSLILDDIMNESDPGGWVSKDLWYEIASRYGYSGRGLAGFFRDEGNGLLEMKTSGTNAGRVRVTRHGKQRLAQNRDRVDAARASESKNDSPTPKADSLQK